MPVTVSEPKQGAAGAGAHAGGARQPLGRVLTPARAALLPLACAAGLAALGLLDTAHHSQTLRWSAIGAAAALTAGTALLVATARRSGRMLAIEVVAKRQHYLQAC